MVFETPGALIKTSHRGAKGPEPEFVPSGLVAAPQPQEDPEGVMVLGGGAVCTVTVAEAADTSSPRARRVDGQPLSLSLVSLRRDRAHPSAEAGVEAPR